MPDEAACVLGNPRAESVRWGEERHRVGWQVDGVPVGGVDGGQQRGTCTEIRAAPGPDAHGDHAATLEYVPETRPIPLPPTEDEVRVDLLASHDEDEFVAAVRASRALHRPWIDLADTPARFASMLARFRSDDHHAFLARHSTCGALVGYVSVSNIVRGAFQSAHLGYGAFAGHEGRGLMTQSLRAVVRIAFFDLGLHRVEANIQPGNERSLALARRVGFQREGYSPRYLFVDGDWRDHERWALRVEDFTPPEGRTRAGAAAGQRTLPARTPTR